MKNVISCLVLAVATAACTSDRPPSAPDELVVEPILVDSVTVAVEASPARVSAHVTGVIGDGCARLLPVVQSRTGSAVRIDIRRERPREAVCIQIAQLYDETIRLEGDFPPGSYSLQVNTLTRSFTVP